MRVITRIGCCCAWLVAFLCGSWAAGALYFDFPSAVWRLPISLCFVVGLIVTGIFLRGKALKLTAFFGGCGLVALWWFSLKPTNNREWQPDVARLAWAEIEGDLVTVHNVRNCDYRTEKDFTPHWESRVVRVSHLTGVDVAIMYWGSPWIAHPIVSFRFADALPLCFSIETRKAIGQSYSAVRGLYRQYTLVYVVADERDSIRVRSNYRHGEEVYLYRTTASPAQARTCFLEYLESINALRDHPRWYNAVTTNCTTSIRTQRSADQRMPWNWRILINGKADELLYERKLLATGGLSFGELKRRSWINERARAADSDPDFSRRVREGLPASD